MQIDFIAEGWKPDLDHFEEWLNTRDFPMPFKDNKGNEIIKYVPAGLRCRRAYTYVFPREAKDVVLNSLQPMRDCVLLTDGKGTKVLSRVINIMRKILRLKKIPIPDPNAGKVNLVRKNIRLVGLGLREDQDITTENGITHEGL